MKPILADEHIQELRRWSRSRVLVAFDFDGTLAPIVAEPNAAKMRSGTAALVAAVAAVYPCAVISGRHRLDVAQRLPGSREVVVVGNHGFGFVPGGEDSHSRVVRWRRRLQIALAGLEGVQVEDKICGLAIHYRRATNKRAARVAILAVARRLRGARLLPGKQVIDVLPDAPINKAVALDWLCQQNGYDRAVYVGDDRTDEDVFSLTSRRLLSIRVGRRIGSAARFYIPDQRAIDRLLRALIEFRSNLTASRFVRS